MRIVSFCIFCSIRHGGKQKYWRIRVPGSLMPSRKPKDLLFHTRAEAETARRELLAAYRAGDLSRHTVLSTAQLRDARRALDMLDTCEVKISLLEAVREAIATRRARLVGISVQELFARYVDETSAAHNWSPKYRTDWRFYARKFLAQFGELHASDVATEAVRKWLFATYTNAASYNHVLTICGAPFGWAIRRKLLQDNPFAMLERRKIEARDGVDVYTPEEASRLLAACQGKLRCALVPFAVLLFAGVRPTELTRLVWGDVRREADGSWHIHIGPRIAKTRQIRLVKVRPTLLAYLQLRPHEAADAPIIPRNWVRISHAVRKLAGLEHRPDAARHSFASYALAAGESIAEVEADLGHAHGSEMLFRHYRAAVTPTAARVYWSLRPPAKNG